VPERAFDLLDEMQSVGLPPDRATYGALLGICGRVSHANGRARFW
jgi:hypothetical protein